MATTPQRNKRTRIDDTSSRDQSSSSPTVAAKRLFTTYCESLQPSLQELLRDSAINQFIHHMELSNRKTCAVSKMQTDPAYVPRSVKLNCTLYCSEELAKRAPEYNGLAEAMAQSVTVFQASAKAAIVEATKLDAKVHQIAAKQSLCEALYQLTSFFVTLNEHPTTQVHKFANTIMERHHEEIMPILSLADFTTFLHFQATYVTYTSATAPLPNPFLEPDLPHSPAGANVAAVAAPNINQ